MSFLMCITIVNTVLVVAVAVAIPIVSSSQS